MSVPYGWLTRLRNRCYDCGWRRVHRVGAPVISVGNLTLGGTGKTPCVEYVARFYRDLGRRPAILSRGYGGGGKANDEALVLRDNLPDVPHLQGKDRVLLALRVTAERRADVLILDDAFQHRRLGRDLDIVLLDATEPWGHGHLFPRGLLREDVAGLCRADVVVLTRCDLVRPEERGRLREEVARLAPGAAVAEAVHRPLGLIGGDGTMARPAQLEDRPVVAFCGLGNPEAFRGTLAGLGLAVRDFRVFPDHHAYSPKDGAALEAWAARQEKDCVVLTSQKDLVKLRLSRLGGRELWALRIGLHLESGRAVLESKLRQVLGVGD